MLTKCSLWLFRVIDSTDVVRVCIWWFLPIVRDLFFCKEATQRSEKSQAMVPGLSHITVNKVHGRLSRQVIKIYFSPTLSILRKCCTNGSWCNSWMSAWGQVRSLQARVSSRVWRHWLALPFGLWIASWASAEFLYTFSRFGYSNSYGWKLFITK